MPNTQYYNERVLNSKFLPGKKDHFLDEVCKIKKYIPSPDKYNVTGDLNMKNPEKRKFSKLPRLTIAEEILKKGTSTPGPGTYRLDFKPRNHQGKHKESDRQLGFINEAQYRGKATPLCHDAKFKLVEEKPRYTLFKLSKAERSVKIEKKPGLSP